MCTVTIVNTADGVRLVCNRDELRSRPPSGAPVARLAGGHRVLMPLDPVSGGTWIGVAQTGLIACVLNATPGRTPLSATLCQGRRSRGEIVPALLECGSWSEAIHRLNALDPHAYPPFVALVADHRMSTIARSDGANLERASAFPITAPMLFTSSGLGDELVRSERTGLFQTLLRESPDPIAAQHAFHRHRWPERAHLSVWMSRADARTVSRTTVDLHPEGAFMRHELFLGEDEPAGESCLAIDWLSRESCA